MGEANTTEPRAILSMCRIDILRDVLNSWNVIGLAKLIAVSGYRGHPAAVRRRATQHAGRRWAHSGVLSGTSVQKDCGTNSVPSPSIPFSSPSSSLTALCPVHDIRIFPLEPTVLLEINQQGSSRIEPKPCSSLHTFFRLSFLQQLRSRQPLLPTATG